MYNMALKRIIFGSQGFHDLSPLNLSVLLLVGRSLNNFVLPLFFVIYIICELLESGQFLLLVCVVACLFSYSIMLLAGASEGYSAVISFSIVFLTFSFHLKGLIHSISRLVDAQHVDNAGLTTLVLTFISSLIWVCHVSGLLPDL